MNKRGSNQTAANRARPRRSGQFAEGGPALAEQTRLFELFWRSRMVLAGMDQDRPNEQRIQGDLIR